MMFKIMKFLKVDLVNTPINMIYGFWALSMFDRGIAAKTFIHYFLYCKSIMLLGNNSKHE